MTAPFDTTVRFFVSRPVHTAWAQLLADGTIPNRGIVVTDDGGPGVLHACPAGDDGHLHVADLDTAIHTAFPSLAAAADVDDDTDG